MHESYARALDVREVMDDHGQLHCILPIREDADGKLIASEKRPKKKDNFQELRNIINRTHFGQTAINYCRDGEDCLYVKKPSQYRRRGSNQKLGGLRPPQGYHELPALLYER